MAYSPSTYNGPLDLEGLLAYFQSELQRIADELTETSAVELRPVHRQPDKPREGMLVFADGADWNPGLGAGVYVYKAGAWSKL